MNKNFFTATEAKERSIAISSGRLEEELEHIYEKINEAINLGKTEVTLYDQTVSSQAKEFLLNKGFKVSWFGGDQRDPCNDTTISW
jgi:hypothetical protein